jgi:hypothetical protein
MKARVATAAAGLVLVLALIFTLVAAAQGSYPRKGSVPLARDGDGTLAVANSIGFRSQVSASGYPGWAQTNTGGFGDPNQQVAALSEFNSYVYAGTQYDITGGQVWRSPDGRSWTEVTPSWSPDGADVYDTEVFGSYLYVGTLPLDYAGGEIWRTDGTTWQQVVDDGFGDAHNYAVNALHVFGGALYAATLSDTGSEIWRSTTGNPNTWTQVNQDGFGSPGDFTEHTMDVVGGFLYVGLGRYGVAELWRTANGTTWVPVFADGLGPNNTLVSAMAEFGGQFYIGLRNLVNGGEVWRSANGLDWQPVITGGLGDPHNQRPYGLIAFDGRLYLAFSNLSAGAEVWQSADGFTWEQVVDAGWGDPNNQYADYGDKAAAVCRNSLYVGTQNYESGGEIWQKLHAIYLPEMLRSY